MYVHAQMIYATQLDFSQGCSGSDGGDRRYVTEARSIAKTEAFWGAVATGVACMFRGPLFFGR